jgi:hypothetical protein
LTATPIAYEVGPDFIRVQFRGGATYLYTDASAGAHHIEQTKRLAAAGNGLNSYIMRHVKHGYARQEG